MSVKVISERVSYKAEPGALQLIILGRIERWKETLLAAWLLLWTVCGIIAIREFVLNPEREMRMVLFVFLFFWGYYLWRVGKVWLYRRGGNELIRIAGEELTLKRSIYTYGKAKTYYIPNIEKFEAIVLIKKSFAYTYENAWWVLGGEKLGFEYQGRHVKFAMQLTDAEAAAVYALLKPALAKVAKMKR